MRLALVLALTALLSFVAIERANADSPNASPQANATLHDLSEWLKTGANRFGEAVEQGSGDLWAAGKAAVVAADDTLREREAARQQSPETEAGRK
jgi:hypothetical protein